MSPTFIQCLSFLFVSFFLFCYVKKKKSKILGPSHDVRHVASRHVTRSAINYTNGLLVKVSNIMKITVSGSAGKGVVNPSRVKVPGPHN